MSSGPRRNLSSAIVDDVLASIARGDLAIGDKLPSHRELTGKYGVGHSVVRDAVQHLVTMGLIDVRPGRGSVVVGLDSRVALDDRTVTALLSTEAIEDLYALRRVIEVAVAQQAATVAGPAVLRRLDALHDEFGARVAAGEPIAQLDIEIHRLIAEASQRPIYGRVLDSLTDAMTIARTEASAFKGASATAYEQHGAVIEAIRQGTAAEAGRRMAEHIDTALATLLALRRSRR